MRYLTSSQDQSDEAFEYLTKLVTQGATVDIKKVLPKRSTNSNNYYHLLLTIAANEFGYSLQEMKVIHKREISPTIFIYEKNERKFVKSSSDLDSKEMSDGIEQLKMWCAKGGLILPEPDEDQKLAYYSNLIETQGRYL